MRQVLFATVLIPARNEEIDLERCLDAVLNQDYPHHLMEIVVVDGGSTDATRDIAGRVLETGDIEWRVLPNPTGTTPSNLNVGLGAANGDILCRVDARSLIPPSYVSTCVGVLTTRSEVRVTGGAQRAVTFMSSTTARGIARALNNRYVMGGARYRSRAESGPADTVYLGVFRTEDVRAIGGWDEAMLTNQDFDLNQRLARDGLVWFDSRLEVDYVARPSFALLWTQYHRFGRWKVRYWRRRGKGPLRRQWVRILALPFVVLVAFAGSMAARRVVQGWLIMLAGLAGLFAVDALGNPDESPPASRVASSISLPIVAAAWWTGLVRECVTRPERR